jgi:hypothetical protein
MPDKTSIFGARRGGCVIESNGCGAMGRVNHLSVVYVLMLLSVSLLPIRANAGWSHDPAVNTAITTQVGSDTNPAITDDGAGGAIIAWMDPSKDIRVQKIDANGNLLWGANGKAITSNGNNYYPQLVSDGSGGAIITWQVGGDGSGGIYVQKVAANGNAPWGTGGELISNQTGNHQYPRIVSDGSGGAVIVWQERLESKTDYDIYAQWVDTDGLELLPAFGLEVCTEAGHQYYPQLVSDGDQSGDSRWVIMTWQDARENWDIYAQKLIRVFDNDLDDYTFSVEWDTGGVAVSSDANTQHLNPRLVNDGSGGAIISWQDGRTHDNAYQSGIYAQRVNADGDAQWTGNGITICDLSGDQINPEMTSDGSGGAIISWWDFRDGAKFAIYGQRVNAAGGALWTTNGVSVATPASIDTNGYSPQITSDGSHGAVITWADQRNTTDENIYAQRIRGTDGAALWTANGAPVSTAAKHQQQPRLISNGSGGFIITWRDLRSGVADIYAQKLLADGTLPATLTVNVVGNGGGGGRVTSDPWGIECTAGSCAASFTTGSQVILTATPNGDSIFGSWSGACTGTNEMCTVTMSGNRSATATFNYVQPVKILGSSAIYTSIGGAYAKLSSGGTIQAREHEFTENLNCNRPISAIIKGGYDTAYNDNSGLTTVKGTVTITSGKLTVENLAIR